MNSSTRKAFVDKEAVELIEKVSRLLIYMKSTKVLTLSSVCKQNYCNCAKL